MLGLNVRATPSFWLPHARFSTRSIVLLEAVPPGDADVGGGADTGGLRAGDEPPHANQGEERRVSYLKAARPEPSHTPHVPGFGSSFLEATP